MLRNRKDIYGRKLQLITRPGTIDDEVVRCVIDANEYRLPERMDGWTVVDVGAHIGSFAAACAMRGAARVLCFEPDRDNAELCRINVDMMPLDNKCDVEVFRLAVYSSTDSAVSLGGYQIYKDTNGVERLNTGCRNVDHSIILKSAMCVTLDHVIDLAGTVDLLKLDCEGSEYPILDSSSRMHHVERLCGEYHIAAWGSLRSAEAWIGKRLFPEFLRAEIKRGESLGFFWAGNTEWWK